MDDARSVQKDDDIFEQINVICQEFRRAWQQAWAGNLECSDQRMERNVDCYSYEPLTLTESISLWKHAFVLLQTLQYEAADEHAQRFSLFRVEISRNRGRLYCRMGLRNQAIDDFKEAKRQSMSYIHARALLDLAAVDSANAATLRQEAINILKTQESVIPRAESWLFGDQYEDDLVAPEFDLGKWEQQHVPDAPSRAT